MAEQRRKLVEAVSTPETDAKERDFVFSDASKRPPAPTPTRVIKSVPRSALTARIRDDYVRAIKRVSLQRQIDGIAPNTLQDIVEEAVAAWLEANGELPRE